MSDNHPTDIYAVMNRKLIPFGVSVELTAHCNLDCIHCYHVKTSRPELTGDEFHALFDDLALLGTMEMTLSGGEPMSRPDFTELLVYAVRNCGFSVKIFSNLTLLSPAIADVMAGLPLKGVETTILGHEAWLHDSLTDRPGSFDALMNGIRLLKERSVKVSAKTVVMKPNLKYLDEIYRLAGELSIPFRHDDCVFIESGGARAPLSLQIPDVSVRRLRNSYGITDNPPYLCNIGKSVMNIGPDGSVYPCGPFPVPAGSIRDSSIAEIWKESEVFKAVRRLSQEDYEVCRSCRYYLRCHGCIAMGMGLASGRKYPCRLARKRLRRLS